VIGKRLELKVPPLVWALFFALLMKGCTVWLPGYSIHLPFAKYFAPILIGLGLSLTTAGIQAVRRAKTTVNPMKPQSTTTVVDSGIYGVTRNPIYVGMMIVLIGWAVHLQNIGAFLMVGLFVATVTQLQIMPEERALEERFGEDYIDYRRRVPRWLFRLTEEDLQL
jgi:protein-S-isoprenylcysteine O-methyltransferase Ste14